MKPVALAFACLYSPSSLADTIGLDKLEVDPGLLAPAPPRKIQPRPAPPPAPPPTQPPLEPRAPPVPEAKPRPSAPGEALPVQAPPPAPRPEPAPAEPAITPLPPAGEAPPVQALPPSPAPARAPAEPAMTPSPPAGGPAPATGEPRVDLRESPQLQPLAETPEQPLPTFLEADAMRGVQDSYVEAEGAVRVRKYGQRVDADRLRYDQTTGELQAEGSVRLIQSGTRVDGTRAEINLETRRGRIEQPDYQLAEPAGRGTATEFILESSDQYRAKNASYTTCPAGVNDWFLHVGDLTIDNVRQVGTARNARLDFLGVPILYTPYLDFPLSEQRKSGLLPPVVGSTETTGTDIMVPYYWNIAPNMDATLAPRFMSKRGVMLDGEYRYLFKDFNGVLRGDWLGSDRTADTDRWGLALQHNHNFGHGFSGAVTYQRVSDDNFLRDFGNRIALTSLVTLPQQVQLGYGAGWWGLSALYQKFQTLQDPASPITPPYDRKPQIALNANRQNLGGFDLTLAGEFSDFQNPFTTQVSGQRAVLYPSVSYPLIAAGSFLVPKFSLHHTRYSLDTTGTSQQDSSRSVPITSLDGGLIFERDWSLGGESFIHTLEPRAFYVYAPFRNQDALPLFDTAVADFNFAQLFSENRFVGNDRISDANQITLALVSRLLTAKDADERVRVAIGQRFNIDSPRVTLTPGTETTESRSDFLAALGVRIGTRWGFDSGWQYNPADSRTQKFSAAVRYQPEPGKVANLAYRHTFQQLEQVGGSVQWPLGGGWWGLGMLDYSLRDRLALNAVLGVEYNAACWALRVVAQRFATTATDVTNQVFLQLELRGLARLGSDPLEVLRQTIPGFQQVPGPLAPAPSVLEY